MQQGNSLGLLSMFATILVACWAAPAQAENKIEEKLAERLGKEVVEAAHPTAKKISLLEYRETISKGRLTATMKMRYYGNVTGARYTAAINITIDSASLQVVEVAYKDDNKIPANKKGLKVVGQELTKRLPTTTATAPSAPAAGPGVAAPEAPAAEPDRRQIARAQRFLEEEKRARAALQFAHFGATYRGAECTRAHKVADDKGRELPGYFALTVRYSWAGVLSDGEHTDIVYFFNDRGRLYGLRSADTTSKVFKPFELSKAVIDLTKEAIRAMVKDHPDKEMKDLVEAAIRDVDARNLLRLRLILEQP